MKPGRIVYHLVRQPEPLAEGQVLIWARETARSDGVVVDRGLDDGLWVPGLEHGRGIPGCCCRRVATRVVVAAMEASLTSRSGTLKDVTTGLVQVNLYTCTGQVNSNRAAEDASTYNGYPHAGPR